MEKYFPLFEAYAQRETPGPHVSQRSVVGKMPGVLQESFSFGYCCAHSAFLPMGIYGVSSQPPRKGGTHYNLCSFFNEGGKGSASRWLPLLVFPRFFVFSYPVFSRTPPRTNKSPGGRGVSVGKYRIIKLKTMRIHTHGKRNLYCTELRFQPFLSSKYLTLQP